MPLQQVVDNRDKYPQYQRTSSAQGHHQKIDFMQKFNTRPQDKDISVYETN